MTSTSASSGSGRSSRSKSSGMSAKGTSGSGKVTPVRPGEDSSKSVGSTTVAALSGLSVNSVIDHLPCEFPQRFDQRFDLFLRIHFCDCNQQVILERGVVLPEVVPADDA